MPTDYLSSLHLEGDTFPEFCGTIRIEDCKTFSPKGLHVSTFTVWCRGCLELRSNRLWLQLKTTHSWDSPSNQVKNSQSMQVNYTQICWFQKGTVRNGLKRSPSTLPSSPGHIMWPGSWMPACLVPHIGGKIHSLVLPSSISPPNPILDYLINALEEVPDFFLISKLFYSPNWISG